MSTEGLRPHVEASEKGRRKIIIFNGREYDVLNLTAQRFSNPSIATILYISRSSVISALSTTAKKLETHTGLQTTKKGIEVGIVDTKILRHGSAMAELNSISAREKKILEFIVETDGEIDYKLLAKHIRRSVNTLKTNLQKLYSKFPKQDMTYVAAVYKSFQPFVGSERPDTLVVIDNHAQNQREAISESNIELFLDLNQRANQGALDENIDFKSLKKLLKKIATRPRFAAMIKGSERGIIFLPAHTEKLETSDAEILQENRLFNQLTQLVKGNRLRSFKKIIING